MCDIYTYLYNNIIAAPKRDSSIFKTNRIFIHIPVSVGAQTGPHANKFMEAIQCYGAVKSRYDV